MDRVVKQTPTTAQIDLVRVIHHVSSNVWSNVVSVRRLLLLLLLELGARFMFRNASFSVLPLDVESGYQSYIGWTGQRLLRRGVPITWDELIMGMS